MSTLSKTVIESIAQKMTEKSRKFKENAYKEYIDVATEIYEATIPKDVMEVFKKHPEYIETTLSVYIDSSHGFSRQSIRLSKSLPANSRYNAELNLNSKTADRLMSFKRKYDKADQSYKDLLRETESALLALKTIKNIRENLPEAIPFLPPPMSRSLVVNFDSLQKKLQKQPEVVKEKAQH